MALFFIDSPLWPYSLHALNFKLTHFQYLFKQLTGTENLAYPLISSSSNLPCSNILLFVISIIDDLVPQTEGSIPLGSLYPHPHPQLIFQLALPQSLFCLTPNLPFPAFPACFSSSCCDNIKDNQIPRGHSTASSTHTMNTLVLKNIWEERFHD